MFTATTFTLLLLPAAPIDADYVIRGATLHDGNGKPGVVGDLAIKGERIVAVEGGDNDRDQAAHRRRPFSHAFM